MKKKNFEIINFFVYSDINTGIPSYLLVATKAIKLFRPKQGPEYFLEN